MNAIEKAIEVLQGCLDHPGADDAIAGLRTEIAAAQPNKQCWKCGDMDPAFQAKCTVPWCGMREAPDASPAEIDGFKTPESGGIEAVQPVEPFGYFRAEPFGWTDCAESDVGAKALYERPATQPAQPIPEFSRIAAQKLARLQADGYTVNGVHIQRTEDGKHRHGAVTAQGMVLWWGGLLDSAPQPAEPVMWQVSWTNPAQQEALTEVEREWGCPESAEWVQVVPRPSQTIEEKVAELEAYRYGGKSAYKVRALYTAPPPPQREPLTEAQIFAIGKQLGLQCRLGGNPSIDIDYARAIEAAHGIGGQP